MINLAGLIDPRLLAAIETNYQAGNYCGAILDSIHFLGELIREKSGLEGDGVALVGQAFGKDNPILKINKLQTESDRNAQRGIEQILRGIYQGIRNPRSHEKIIDNVEVAEPIILFVNYLIVIIDHSRSPFEKEAYIQQVFDPSFTESAKYADLMVEEIPVSKKWDILIEVYRRKGTTANPNKLRYFMAAILGKLSTEEQAQFCDIVSDELKATNIEAVIRTIFQIMPVEYWCKYSERARMRTEGRVIDSIRSGKHDATQGKCLSGAFATWARDCMEHFVLKEELTAALVDKLGSSDRQEQDYVLAYFFKTLLALQPVPSWLLIQHFRDGLKASNTRFRNALAAYNWGDEVPWMDTLPEGWQKALKKDYESFVETSEVAFDQGITDDDVPF